MSRTGATTRTHGVAKTSVPRIGGTRASGGEDRLDGGEEDLQAEEAAERARDGALEDLDLVGVSRRDHAVHPGEDVLAVGKHVEAEDDDEDERAEDRSRHLRGATYGGGRRVHDRLLDLLVDLGEV